MRARPTGFVFAHMTVKSSMSQGTVHTPACCVQSFLFASCVQKFVFIFPRHISSRMASCSFATQQGQAAKHAFGTTKPQPFTRLQNARLSSHRAALSQPSAGSSALGASLVHHCNGAAVRSSRRRSCNILCQAAPNPSGQLTIAITGATGLIGARLTHKLTSQGHIVRVLTRNVNSARAKLPYPRVKFFAPSQWAEGIQGADAAVNLAGEPIATRWTPEHKAGIKTSRISVTKNVVSLINSAPAEKRPKALVSASAVGYYGTSQSTKFVEDSPAGQDYLAEICKEWEAAALEAEKAGVRTAIMRIGIVLAPDGGAVGKMLPIFQMFAGGPLGSGRQWMSWIHRDDLVSLIVEAVKNPGYKGVFNATAPKPVRMSELCSALGNIMGRPSWLPVPDFALQTLLGEGATVVLEGQCVLPSRTQAQGFTFRFQEVGDALKNILRN